jgi:hypothetical protein
MQQDIRWQQRFSNFLKAFEKLSESVAFLTRASQERVEKVRD